MDRNKFEIYSAAYVEGLLNKELSLELEAQAAKDPACNQLVQMNNLVMDILNSVEKQETPSGLDRKIFAAVEKQEQDAQEDRAFRKRAFYFSLGLACASVLCTIILTQIAVEGGAASLFTGYSFYKWLPSDGFLVLLEDSSRMFSNLLFQSLPFKLENVRIPDSFIISSVGCLIAGVFFWSLQKKNRVTRLLIH